jgi:hypothetical protein
LQERRVNAAVEMNPTRARFEAFRAMTPEQRRARALEAQAAEDRAYRAVQVREAERALSGSTPTRWKSGRWAPMARAPLALADYPQRANGGALAVVAEPLPDHRGEFRFTGPDLRIARIVAADGSSWIEVAEVSR